MSVLAGSAGIAGAKAAAAYVINGTERKTPQTSMLAMIDNSQRRDWATQIVCRGRRGSKARELNYSRKCRDQRFVAALADGSRRLFPRNRERDVGQHRDTDGHAEHVAKHRHVCGPPRGPAGRAIAISSDFATRTQDKIGARG
jgi:hypothetical protein